MLSAYKHTHAPDGALNFFAVDPAIKGKGIGTLLLNELERRQKGKRVFLFTDSGSTFQFYQRRGFGEQGRREITMQVGKEQVPLTCYLFDKVL